MALTTRVLIGLILGLVGGIAISSSNSESLGSLPGLIEPVGTLWVNAIRMTVVPLIISLLITAIVGNHNSNLVARLGGKSLAFYISMIVATSVYTALAAPPLLALIPLDPANSDHLRAASALSTTTVELPPFRDWLVGLIPSNPIKAAVEGTMLPLVVFITLFAFAINRIAGSGRDALLGFFTAVRDAMFVLIGWVMSAAPFGVFALMLSLSAQMGANIAGAFGYFLLITCGLIVAVMILLYPLVNIVSGVSIASFARACLPAQVVGIGTRSSLASLPAMFTATESLGLAPRVSGLVLPIAVSIFKFASPVGRITGTYFIARLYGIDLGPTEIAVIAAAIGLLSFYSPGVPSSGLFIMMPLYTSLNFPLEGIGILIALDMIVDMVITPANVTANIAVATMLAGQTDGSAE